MALRKLGSASTPEQGTFTPVFVGLTSAGNGTYSTQYGHYFRIGKLCFMNLCVVCTAHNGTGTLLIQGLPFVAVSDTTTGAAYATGLGFSGQLTVVINGGNIQFKGIATNAASTPVAMDAVSSVYVTLMCEVV